MQKPREPLRWFAEYQEQVLSMNDGKGGWGTMTRAWLLARLDQERDELLLAMHDGDPAAIMKEAADVANFAMMIADNERGRTCTTGTSGTT